MTTRETPFAPGTPCWVDYAADDPNAAKRFYGSLLGWEFDEGDPEYGGYAIARTSGRAVAAVSPKMSPETPSAWTTYFASADPAATAAAVTANGGVVVAGPMQVGDAGHMAVAVDPAGTVFGLWQAGAMTGFELYNEPGGVIWNSGEFTDPDAVLPFYEAVLGVGTQRLEAMGGYTMLTVAGDGVAGVVEVVPGRRPGWQVYFSVADTDTTAAAAAGAGGEVRVEPQDAPFGRYAVIADPWGATFNVSTSPAQ